MFYVILALAVLASANARSTRRTGCTININSDLLDPQPLLLVANATEPIFVDPVDTWGTLEFAVGESVRLVCPGSSNYLVNVGPKKVSDANAVCVGGKIFSIGSTRYQFSSLVCQSLAWHECRRTGKRCLGTYTQVEIGFNVGNGFFRVIEVCRDDDTYTTLYTKSNLTKGIGGYQRGYPRPNWLSGSFYSRYNMNAQYRRATQIATVSTVVNSTILGASYVHTNTDYYFSRGHMVAKADFVYGSAMRATFWYVNSAPQWQTFNGGNWNSLESDVRSFASSRQLDLTIYTGVHGISSLADINGVEQPMYFYARGNARGLPVPKFYWKVIYDPISKKASAFVGVNDPHVSKLTDDYFICTDISSKFNWLTWVADSIELGISYACTYDDLRAAIPTVPKIKVNGILV
ncbi:uncharacterized protein LOC107272885 [Cephus cinctus]|uniref:Uncharacterized protein LOC107272885 n=1 Tax=Cephus cinctus TaxID=211228 RepID=A0AAJ7FSF0_CEPCN|nr:uncharacterized protein LOC107272885 [Cephus cinctus]